MIRTGWIAIAIGCAGVIGCGGGGGGNGADAPAGGIDAPAGSIDAPGAPADADLRPVTVTVYDDVPPIVPTAGLSVVFSHPDGTVTSVATTGADGKATGMVSAGDTVTALGMRDSWSVLDVHPGDDLTIGVLDHAGAKLGTFVIDA